MSVKDFSDWLGRLGVTTTVYPLTLPTTAPHEAVVIHTGSGTGLRGDVQDLILTVRSRAKHPETAEGIGLDVIERLKNITNENVGILQVIVVRPQEKIPQFLGKDENDYYYFENNFTVLVSD